MLFTRATEYALLALVVIAKEERPLGTDYLSRRLNISRSFLAKILQALAKQDILKSYKGASGGFQLARPANQLSIKEISTAAEGKGVNIFDCSSDQACCPSNKGDFCTLWPFLNKLQTRVDDFLEELTLQDLME
ncbi:MULTISPECIES: Rrf2 family transcriptional regulator [unclassified Nitratiruptor]|uniref:RrF2 family transcriptional regulator n=1 Tax=unclassified Nitratiruptor TaxID=2624044 RepID=UPI0001586FD7|nr:MULTISPECIES: Rrf2 family transcriptional regulator [unclassified Nitratiruptor]BAF70235.1 transcriptional regulator, BadM/Rrf2 family [Nitratiruptor sp. SB155-2]BCD60151.1 Rrf2 family transcriptional regulator [Nitratiruptor sp. YY08-10]BCD64360.1 Rrf2 family transcriptional regulator [Nitratiruptor sp. YY08-14]